VGLEFYSYTNDPSYPGFTWASGQGLAFLNPTSWLLIEDCKFSFYANGIGFIFPPYGANNVTARRNVVVDNYGNGIFAGGIPSGFLVEENIVDHNGWNAAEARGNALNHNLYLTGATDNPAPVTVRGNIVSNDTAGSQLRSGGIITNNLWIQNPYAHNLGMPTAGVMTIVDNNVYTEAVALGTAYGWGVDVPAPTGYNLGTVTFSNNIMTQTASPTAGLGIRLAAGTTGTLTNNIFFNWQNPVIDQTSGTVTYTGYNLKDAAGANNLGAPEPFPSPGRTVGTYYDSIVGSSGHTSFDFIAAARRQSKDNWNPALMATPVNDYIRAGFGITTNPTTPPPPTPTTDTTAPSVPTGLAATAVSDTQVNLAWTASTDNIGVTGYKIFRNGVQVGTTSSTSYQNTGLAGGTAYSFAVAAYDAAGNASAQSSSVSVTTSATTTSDSPPSVAVVSPKNGSTPNGSINIGVSASSAIGIASITITADGNPLATCMDVTSCSATWQKKKLTRGTHTIRGTAIDKQGKSADASVLVTILR
jgi:hypothetical protein